MSPVPKPSAIPLPWPEDNFNALMAIPSYTQFLEKPGKLSSEKGYEEWRFEHDQVVYAHALKVERKIIVPQTELQRLHAEFCERTKPELMIARAGERAYRGRLEEMEAYQDEFIVGAAQELFSARMFNDNVERALRGQHPVDWSRVQDRRTEFIKSKRQMAQECVDIMRRNNRALSNDLAMSANLNDAAEALNNLMRDYASLQAIATRQENRHTAAQCATSNFREQLEHSDAARVARHTQVRAEHHLLKHRRRLQLLGVVKSSLGTHVARRRVFTAGAELIRKNAMQASRSV